LTPLSTTNILMPAKDASLKKSNSAIDNDHGIYRKPKGVGGKMAVRGYDGRPGVS
jgi:hypothetical protein